MVKTIKTATNRLVGVGYLNLKSFLSHVTRVVAGAGDRRFLVPQYEAGTHTGYRAAPTR
jgi:hypothetical protein